METANKRTHSHIGIRNCRVPSQYVRSAEGYSAAAEPCWRMEKPWTLSKPARGTLPLNPFQKTPPTPSIFEGAPSPVGRSKQSFDNAKRVWGLVWLSIYFCSLCSLGKTALAPLPQKYIDNHHMSPSPSNAPPIQNKKDSNCHPLTFL
ncbi:hypothetical protein JOC94_004736 [Bacillus thermophilus]|uniref:Uncharacterized protein n=1 Tax=Siminovitchia thermophila TaxID=1245522 RepID=A0ABS2RED1_9BACI|nr:hypothetical protein [Siminovitchia thermophila]